MTLNVHWLPTCCSTTSEDQCCRRTTQVGFGIFVYLTEFVLDFSLTDLSKLIGQEWKNLNEDQRKVRNSPPFYINYHIHSRVFAYFFCSIGRFGLTNSLRASLSMTLRPTMPSGRSTMAQPPNKRKLKSPTPKKHSRVPLKRLPQSNQLKTPMPRNRMTVCLLSPLTMKSNQVSFIYLHSVKPMRVAPKAQVSNQWVCIKRLQFLSEEKRAKWVRRSMKNTMTILCVCVCLLKEYN